jgi:hypothetical protein
MGRTHKVRYNRAINKAAMKIGCLDTETLKSGQNQLLWLRSDFQRTTQLPLINETEIRDELRTLLLAA